MKILKIERSNYCKYFRFVYSESGKWNRFKCAHPETKRKNGNSRIINRKLALSGRFPKWCPLEDCHFQPTYLKE